MAADKDVVTSENLQEYVGALWDRAEENGYKLGLCDDGIVACNMCDGDVGLEKFVWPDNEYSEERFQEVKEAVRTVRTIKG